MCRGTVNVEYEMRDFSGNNWSHQNSNKRFTEKSGSHIRKLIYYKRQLHMEHHT
jgi:hypothetical protein